MANNLHTAYGLLDQLRKDGWTMQDMSQYEHRIFQIVPWCRETFGDMLVIYDVDEWRCRWHGTTLKVNDRQHLPIFAFKDPADLTLLQLRWA